MSRLVAAVRELPQSMRRITTGKVYRPEIDGLRFFAISIVIIGHIMQRVERSQANVAPPSDIEHALLQIVRPGLGVLLFFAVSGFIIGSQFLRGPAKSPNWHYLRAYFLRRVTRIEPPYFILLVGTYALLSAINYVPQNVNHFNMGPESLSLSLFASLAYSHGWLFGTFPRLFPPGWSLEIEVQFYILAPLFFFLFFKITDPILRLRLGIAIEICACLLAPLVNAATPGRHLLGFTLGEFFQYFWLGIVLADVNLNSKELVQRYPKAWASSGAWLGLILMIGAGAFLEDGMIHGGTYAYLFLNLLTVVAILLLFGGALQGPTFRAVCSRPWISLLGGACYSLYLTHLQIIHATAPLLHAASFPPLLESALSLAVQIPLIFGGGLIFYALLERPFMVPEWPTLIYRKYFGRHSSVSQA
jgi:peptidoglycan/LPS O-acetylase OafA/YrhL